MESTRKNQLKMCQSHKIPGAYAEPTRSIKQKAKVMPSARDLFFALMLESLPMLCTDRIVMAVAVAVGKMRFSSRATWMMKNFRTVAISDQPNNLPTQGTTHEASKTTIHSTPIPL